MVCGSEFVWSDNVVMRLVGINFETQLNQSAVEQSPERIGHLSHHSAVEQGTERIGHQIWSGRRESNPRHTAWEAVVLPLNYARLTRFA